MEQSYSNFGLNVSCFVQSYHLGKVALIKQTFSVTIILFYVFVLLVSSLIISDQMSLLLVNTKSNYFSLAKFQLSHMLGQKQTHDIG